MLSNGGEGARQRRTRKTNNYGSFWATFGLSHAYRRRRLVEKKTSKPPIVGAQLTLKSRAGEAPAVLLTQHTPPPFVVYHSVRRKLPPAPSFRQLIGFRSDDRNAKRWISDRRAVKTINRTKDILCTASLTYEWKAVGT